MAIYRPERPRRRPRLSVLLLGLVVGAAIVGLLVRDGDPSPEERNAAVRTALIEASGLLEIVEIEYAEAVENGRVVAETELEGAEDALSRSGARYRSVRTELVALNLDVVAEIDAGYAAMEAAVGERTEAERLSDLIGRLTDKLETAMEGIG